MTIEVKVMVGTPGSGKSTWAHKEAELLEMDGFHTTIISRDEIRKSFVGDGSYFGKENDVFEEFVRQINECLEIGIDYVFVDATHISQGSRAKLLGRLRPDGKTRLVFEVCDCGIDTCIARNSLREGFSQVPESAIRKMARNYRSPTPAEFELYKYGFKEVRINHHGMEERDK